MMVTRVNINAIRESIKRDGVGAVETVPLVRFSLRNEGCGLPNCNCSDGYWLTVSDGETLLKVDLTAEEAASILDGSAYEIK